LNELVRIAVNYLTSQKKHKLAAAVEEACKEKFCFCEISAGGEPCRDRAHCDKFNDRVQ
jgi:hypothetical protein